MASGAFRQDLYYRLNVFPVHVPALRERVEDIPLLAEHFLRRFVRKHGVKVTGFADSARAVMLTYRWPGNVRELQNTIERAVILSEPGRPVTAAALGLPAEASGGSPEVSAHSWGAEHMNEPRPRVEESAAPQSGLTDGDGQVLRLEALEKNAIRAALKQTGGKRAAAADALGISIRTLRNKLQEYRDAGDPIDVGADASDN